MCSWPLDSPLHCRICASHPDIALERVAARRRPSVAEHSAVSAAATRHQRRRAVRSKSCESSQIMFASANCPDAAIDFENVTAKSAACPVNENRSAASSAENATFCNQYKSRKTKSYAFLLIFICVVFVRTSYSSPVTSSGQRLILHSSPSRQRYHQKLLLQQRAIVEPTPPHYHHLHHRSVPESSSNMEEANQNAGGDYDCQLVVRALKKAQKQANATFQTIRAFLAEFTQNQYNQQPEEVFRLWQMHQLHLKHPYADHILRDYDVTPDAAHYGHLLEQPFSRQTLTTELQKVYITLKTLDNAFDEVIKNRKARSDLLIHDLNNTRENYNIINKFFEEAHRHVRYDLQETTDAMDKLSIPIPEVDANVQYDRSNVSMGDYLLANEHLSVMQYLLGMYTFLLAQCSAH